MWFRASVVAVVVGVSGWLAVAHHDRVVNQDRLSGIAGEIAGRRVRVHCPGVIGRVLSWDVVEGSVRFDASGRPSDTADLRARTCAELDALAEHRRDGAVTTELAMAVDVLTHESFHLQGIADEAATECHSLNTMARTAERLGATPEQARALASLELRTNYLELPDRYRSPPCVVIAEHQVRAVWRRYT
jgi:hypothetical protein